MKNTNIVIEIKNLSKKFKGEFAVQNLDLEIHQGEVFGFLGPNGAGKTTTVKMILGFLRPTKGKVLLLNEHNSNLLIKEKIGFLPEHTYFYQHLTGAEFLYFVGEIFKLPPKTIQTRVKKLLKKVNLPKGAENKQIRDYSKGMQQRIGLAQSLMNDPEVVFLDEPMSGLDPVGRREIKNLILELKKEGKTVFFNSHILEDAELLCDRVGIIKKGKLASLGTVKELTQNGKISLEEYFVQVVRGKAKKSPVKKKPIKKIVAKKKTPKKTATKKVISKKTKK